MLPTAIKGESLVVTGNLGEGSFGHVKKATLTKSKNKAVDVALKFFFRDGLREELKVMSVLKNKYIVKLYGSSKVKENPCLVMEFMNQGCLGDFVRKNKKKLTKELMVIKNLIEDVARGMKFLCSKGFVHRDLAARNVLVHLGGKNNFIGKIADFGLTRDDTYYQSIYGVNAFCWMPLEVHEGHGHTPASDVWSFGILCWEAYTFGREPFSGLRPAQVRAVLKAKKIPLKCPKFCPRMVFDTMKLCWMPDPDDRITFTKLVKELSSFQ